ncbi:MAG: rod shape-determining protein MreC [Acidimicrobiales bacterium]|nr:rod shape-determining protein MreC [Acidimicrobiales bacterium]
MLISITVIALDAGNVGPLNSVKSGLGTVLSPVRAVGDSVFGPVGDAFNGVFNREDLGAENDRLRSELEALRAQQSQAQQAAAELEQMRDALDLPTLDDIVATHAEVVGGSGSNFDRTIEIDKGANAGIRRGMPVVTAASEPGRDLGRSALLVGRVVDVSLNSAHVQLLTDPGFTIGVKHVLSGDIGVADGRGADSNLRVAVGLDATTEITPGDFFTTSGLDRSLFPAGITVGFATEEVEAAAPVPDDEGRSSSTTTSTTVPSGRSIEQTIDLAPAADLDHLSFVSVLLWTPGS